MRRTKLSISGVGVSRGKASDGEIDMHSQWVDGKCIWRENDGPSTSQEGGGMHDIKLQDITDVLTGKYSLFIIEITVKSFSVFSHTSVYFCFVHAKLSWLFRQFLVAR